MRRPFVAATSTSPITARPGAELLGPAFRAPAKCSVPRHPRRGATVQPTLSGLPEQMVDRDSEGLEEDKKAGTWYRVSGIPSRGAGTTAGWAARTLMLDGRVGATHASPYPVIPTICGPRIWLPFPPIPILDDDPTGDPRQRAGRACYCRSRPSETRIANPALLCAPDPPYVSQYNRFRGDLRQLAAT